MSAEFDPNEQVRVGYAQAERQALALSEVTARAASGVPVQSLLEDVVDVVGVALGADLTVLLEHEVIPDRLRVKAGWGLPPGLIGTDVSAGRTNQAGYTMLSGRPVVSLDTGSDPRFGLPVELGSFGLRGALSVLVESRSKIWGVLVAASRQPRRFTAREIRFVQSVAQLAGLCIDRARMEHDRDAMETRLDLALDVAHMGIWEFRASTDRLWVSPTVERMLGMEPGSFDGSRAAILDRIPEEHAANVLEVTTAQAAASAEWGYSFPVFASHDELRWFEILARTVIEEDGSTDRTVGVAVDVTERREVESIRSALVTRADEMRHEAVEARERFAFLASAGARMAELLDPDEVAESIVETTVGRLADYCVVDLYDRAGIRALAAIGHVDHLMDPLLRRSHRYSDDGNIGTRTVLDRLYLQRRSGFYPEASATDILGTAVDDEHREMLRNIDTRSSMLLPMVARDQLIGGIALGRVGDSPPFDEDDLALAEGIASRAAVALDNARLYADRVAVVRSLQETLIPPALPEVPGLELAARYRVAEGGIDIGGDFYDVFPLAGQKVALVIGDVSGKGPSAAAVTGVVRQALRTSACYEHGPAAALAAVNDVLIPQIAETRFCTALLAWAEVLDEGVTLMVANGGHPRPCLVRRSGEAEIVPVQGTLLGVVQQVELADAVVLLGPGDSLVMVTDGVTESRSDGAELGEDGLVALLAGVGPGASADEIADAVVAGAARFAHGEVRDDLAVLVIRAATG